MCGRNLTANSCVPLMSVHYLLKPLIGRIEPSIITKALYGTLKVNIPTTIRVNTSQGFPSQKFVVLIAKDKPIMIFFLVIMKPFFLCSDFTSSIFIGARFCPRKGAEWLLNKVIRGGSKTRQDSDGPNPYPFRSFYAPFLITKLINPFIYIYSFSR